MCPCQSALWRDTVASMYARWLKSILPKGLYGRTALILILPVITIMLVVSVVFMQRHFDGVTRQMTRSAVFDLRYLLRSINAAPDRAQADAVAARISTALGFSARPLRAGDDVASGRQTIRPFGDLTGRSLVSTLREEMPRITRIDLARDGHQAIVQMPTRWGPYQVSYERSRMSASAPHQLLVLMFVAALIMTAIAFVVLRNQVRPIRNLARAAEAFGRGQSIAFHVSGATEVRQAGRAFLDMRDRIERQIEQRTLMLSGVSHDLRTPLTRLKLGLSMVPESDETRALSRDVDDMEMMLDEFLAFARGDSLEETKACDPLDLARQIVKDMARGQQDIRLITPEIPLGSGVPLVPMRPNAVRRALENLLNNARRYGTTCCLEVILRPGEVVFRVEDNGPGIPEADRDRALRPFERLDLARNQNRGGGVGLGLAIVLDIAISHGGALRLGDSKALGGLRCDFVLSR